MICELILIATVYLNPCEVLAISQQKKFCKVLFENTMQAEIKAPCAIVAKKVNEAIIKEFKG